MIKKFLNTQTKNISLASLILAGSYLFSAVLGVLRDRFLAGKFGLGNELDVYYTAFTVPDFIALILIFGAISAAIIPIFSSYLTKSNPVRGQGALGRNQKNETSNWVKDEAWRYVSNLLNVFLTFLIIVCVILAIFTPLLVELIAPGFSADKKVETVLLMRIMFLSPIILGTSSIISGILQVFHRFLVTALAPIMYNLGIIIGIIFFVPMFGLAGLAWGVVFGGLMHLLIQIPAFLHSGFRYELTFDLWHPGVKKTLRLMVPRSLGLGAGQLNTIVITAIASTLAKGSIAVYNLANTLSSLLVNAIAISLSTAVFPTMSLAHSKEDTKDFERKFLGAFSQIMFLSVPISISIFLLRSQIVRVFYGTGKVTWLDTRLIAASLGIFSLGLFAQGLVFLLSKTFYAIHNTKIPAIISACTVAFNIVMSFVLLWLLSFNNIVSAFLHSVLKLQTIENINVIGLVVAFTITAIVEALLLLFFIHKKLHIFNARVLMTSLYKMLVSGILMAVAILLVRNGLVIRNIVNLQTFIGVFLQLVLSVTAGFIFYIATSFLLKSPEIHTIKESFFRKFNE